MLLSVRTSGKINVRNSLKNRKINRKDDTLKPFTELSLSTITRNTMYTNNQTNTMKQLLFLLLLFLTPSLVSAQDEKSTEFLENAKWGELEEMKKLLADGADINAKNSNGDHAGVYAMYHFEDDEGEMIRFLLEEGLNPTILTDENANLMHLAVENEGSEILAELNAKGVDVNAQNEDGDTPLLLAASNREYEAVKLLVSLGANPNLTNDGTSIIKYYDLEDEDLWNDLMTFPFSDEILHTLMIEAVYTLESPEKVRQLLEKDANWDEATDEDGAKLLHLAAELDDSEILQLLLENGVNPNQVNDDGENALWSADAKENATLLINAGTDVNQVIDGESLLSAHIYYGMSDFVYLFIASGADVHFQVDGNSLVKYCKELLKMEERPGPKYANPEDQQAALERWHADIEKSMDYLKQNGVK